MFGIGSIVFIAAIVIKLFSKILIITKGFYLACLIRTARNNINSINLIKKEVFPTPEI